MLILQFLVLKFDDLIVKINNRPPQLHNFTFKYTNFMEGNKNSKWKNSSVDKRVEDIRVFLAKLSARLQDGKYEEFLTIMKAYKEQRLDVDTVILRLRDILKGNKGLINEVNRILPPER